jgi:hypothetical protein
MKKFRRLIALVLALLALPVCLLACDKEGGADQTEDPNDTTEGIRVIITISGLEEKDGTRTPLLKTKEAEIFRVDPGTTLKGALDALCASREGASYEIDVTGDFSKFTYGSDKLEAAMEEQKDGSFVPVSFKVTVNGTEITDAPNYVLNHNDNVQIFLVKGDAFTAKQ